MHTSNNGNPDLLVRLLSTTLFLFGIFALIGSLFVWGQGFIFSVPEGTDLRYPITDLIVNVPATFIAAVGLWRMKTYGYIASQFVAGFYVYASVEIFVDLWQHGAASKGQFFAILIPQVLAVIVAFGLVFYLWKIRTKFFRNSTKTQSHLRD
jgi:hypothetical protein